MRVLFYGSYVIATVSRTISHVLTSIYFVSNQLTNLNGDIFSRIQIFLEIKSYFNLKSHNEIMDI